MDDNQISKFLFAIEGIGAIFVGAFLSAYLMGLPTYVVYHSDPNLRSILSLFGAVLIVLVITSLVVSFLMRKK